MKSALFLWQARRALAIRGVTSCEYWTQSIFGLSAGPTPGSSQSKAGRVSPIPRGSKPTRSKDALSEADWAGSTQMFRPGAPGPPGLAKSVPIFVPEAGSF